MPSHSANHPERQVQPGPSPLSQSPQSTVADQNLSRPSRKKGKKAAVKEPVVFDVEEPLVDEVPPPSLPSPSPPQPPKRFRNRAAEEVGDDKQPIRSPVLDALSSLEADGDIDNTSRTTRWTKTVPLGMSPPIDPPGTHVVSESPPFPPKLIERGGFNSASPPLSPPQRKARPLSFGGQSASSRQPSAEKNHRYTPGSASFVQPPLPHLPQAHFYGAPDINLGLGEWGTQREPAYKVKFTSFDVIPVLGDHGLTTTKQSLLIGLSGRLDVFTVNGDKVKHVGCLKDLTGDVIGAKIIPIEASPASLIRLCPLVAVVTHGPRSDDETELRHESGSGSDDSEVLGAERMHPQLHSQQPQQEFQTRVTVFSLITQERVATLFVSQVSTFLPGFRGQSPSPPPPVGDLTVSTQGSHIILSSGTSGEIFVYGVASGEFRCLAKLWTTIQSSDVRKYSSSSASTESDVSPADPYRGQHSSPLALFTLNGRWLAIVPPTSPSRPSINGVIPASLIQGFVLGLETTHAPAKPPVICVIDSPETESILNKVARGVAKEVVKGARWLGEQGMQTWNSYWNREVSPPQPSTLNGRYTQPQEPTYPAGVFPPTHAPEMKTTSDEPEIVSILDLERLGSDSNRKVVDTVAPIATFQPPGGCSFLSFSPTGLTMLTATKKGDVQYIWDLMQIMTTRVASLVSNYPASVDGDANSHSPRVRQIAKYARLSSSSIVDVIWAGPIGDRFASLTRNGTVHVFDVPQSAFQWPPPRRIVKVPQSPSLSPSRASEPDSTSGVFASAIKFAGKTQPMLANLRGRAPSMGNTFGGMGGTSIGFASATGVRSGKAMAAGLSKSVGAATDTVSHLRHAGENRVHLQSLARDPRPGRVMWSLRGEPAIFVLDAESIRVFRIRRREVAGKQSQRSRVSVIDARRSTESKIPSSEQFVISPETGSGFWRLPLSTPKSKHSLHSTHPLSRAEIETNSPYQPFHSDRRVHLFVFKSTATSHEINLMGDSFTSSSGQNAFNATATANTNTDSSQWVFGDVIPTTKLNLRSPSDDLDELDDPTSLGGGTGSTIIRQAQSTHGAGQIGEDPVDQIVITTRRKKNKPTATVYGDTLGHGLDGGLGDVMDDDGFFEDDCDVLDWAGDRV